MTGLSACDGRILGPDGWVVGEIVFARTVQAVRPTSHARADRLIVPGFIDLHVHGGGGADAMEGEDAVRRLAACHARRGTTALLATTVTAPDADLRAALRGIAAVAGARRPGEAAVLGVHLEGPYISGEKLGAQPPFQRPLDRGDLADYLGLAPIRAITLAPEACPDPSVVDWLASSGVRVQLGHSACSYQAAVAALARGAHGITHLYNAMSGFHHRGPGLCGAALAHARYAEIIPDLLHVSEGAIHLARRAIPGLYGVTDAISAACMPDGLYQLGRHAVERRGEGVYLPDGTLAGSTLTMDQAFRNLNRIGLSVEEASSRLSRLPAEYLGLPDRGVLREGSVADIVVLDEALSVVEVFVGGERIDLAAGP